MLLCYCAIVQTLYWQLRYLRFRKLDLAVDQCVMEGGGGASEPLSGFLISTCGIHI